MNNVEIKYIQTKTKLLTIEINGYLLHSKYDPVKEAKRIIEKEFIENYVHVLFGFGLGYLAEAFAEKVSREQLIIVDPFKEQLALENSEVIDSNDEKEIKSRLKNSLKNYSREVKVICAPNYEKIAPIAYHNLLKIIKDVQRFNQVEENTIRFGSEFWQENYIKNLIYAFSDNSLNELEKKYECPIVIASGGPSLTKQLSLLKTIREQVILIASGSTVNSLVSEGITPDYIVTIDGAEANYRHFKDLVLPDSILLYCLSSNYKIQQEYIGKRYPFLTTNDFRVGEHLKESLNINLPYMAGGGSVAHFAFTIAIFLTNGPIALIGQDLAFTNNQSHATNNKHHKVIDEKLLKDRDAFEVEGYFGDKVLTDYSLYSMKTIFEKLHKGIVHSAPIFNCTEGGVKLDGFMQLPFESFIKKYIGNILIEKIEQEELSNSNSICILIEQLRKEINVYNQLEKDLVDAISILKANQHNSIFKQADLKKLDKIDRKIKDNFNLVMMDRIVEPLTIDVLRNFKANERDKPKQNFDRVYNQNLELYSRLLEASKKSKRFTLETIEIIETTKL